MIASAMWYLGYLLPAAVLIKTAFRSRSLTVGLILIAAAVAFAMTPFVLPKKFEEKAKVDAVDRQTYIANLPRYDIRLKMPKKIVNLGRLSEKDLQTLSTKYGIKEFNDFEDERLKEAYASYRRTEYCYRHIAGTEPKSLKNSPLGMVPSCNQLPESMIVALKPKMPAIYFVENKSMSEKMKGPIQGTSYEIRYISATEDLLIDYFEQKTVEEFKRPGQVTSGRKLDHTHKPPRRMEFITLALSGKKANTKGAPALRQ